MKIEQFIDEFNKSEKKELYVKKHITTDYIPFERKVAVSELIAKKMTLENGDLIKNTPMVYENFILSLVREYTDIEIDKDESLTGFNLMERYGATECLVSTIGRDAKSFNTILDMIVADTIDNHNNLVNHLNLKADNIGFILDKVQDVMQSLSMAPKVVIKKD